MAEDTKGTICLYAVLGFVLVVVLAALLTPAGAIGPAILLIVWLCRKVKGRVAGKP